MERGSDESTNVLLGLVLNDIMLLIIIIVTIIIARGKGWC